MKSLISFMTAAGIYCQRCGRFHIFDIPYFPGGSPLNMVCPHCGQVTANVYYKKRTSIELSLDCSICGAKHISVYQKKLLPKVGLNRIYCHHDNFELGFIGKKRQIEAVMAASQAAFEELNPGEDNNSVKGQRQMLETVNMLHDMASAGNLACSCGCQNMFVQISGTRLILECGDCGRVASINTADSEAVEHLADTRRLCFRKIQRRQQGVKLPDV